MRFTTRLLPSRSSNLGILTLNNPEKLHALTLDMLECLQDVLPQWYADDSMAAILIKSSPTAKTPAFCAGGDVKQVYLSGLDTTETHGQGIPGVGTAEFFRQEYQVNHLLATSNKPHISFWDGIVMGGGVGLSIHSHFRVATEHTVWAMPETAIGLFPDVGTMYWMPRLLQSNPHNCAGLAAYLACTGHRLRAVDLIGTGIATHYVPSATLPAVEAALIDATTNASNESDTPLSCHDALDFVLASFHQTPVGESTLDPTVIAHAFGPTRTPSLESIVESLHGWSDGSNTPTSHPSDASKLFAQTTLTTLQKMSPTSLKVTLEGLHRGAAHESMAEDLAMEFRMSQACMRRRPQSDFYEGIRAVLIDKDHTPQWQPARMSDVTDEMVASYFAPLPHEWQPLERPDVGDATSKL